ncbi:hypothetical protein ACFORL_05720 [Legionella dresdenensis]|uniref:Uncharacterized protein n=1 Tax=Legionella dresdenensis TaxID=450200 RepID=A0ABV8CF47_9GAMM
MPSDIIQEEATPVNQQIKPDIVFIGAGPVGLWTAIVAKLTNPDQQILMLERNKKYTRSHILIIDPTSFVDAPQDPRLQPILEVFKGPVPTSEIEGKLRKLALDLGIVIENKKVENVNSLQQLYPSAHTIVGADGAKSTVRQQIFGDEKSVDYNLQYIVEVKYSSSTDTRKLGPLENIEGLSQINHFVAEHVGKKNDEGNTPVSLFFFVDKQTYDQVYSKGASGLKLEDITAGSSQMTNLANSIHPWLAYRKSLTDEKLIDSSVKISAVALNNYKAKNTVKVVNGKRYMLVGDAALGIPFFRALNAGFLGGTKAGKAIATSQPNNKTVNNAFENDMAAIAKKEIKNANWKNIKVVLGRHGAGKLAVSKGIIEDTMPAECYQAIKNARVTPLPWYKRYRALLTGLAFFLVLAAILAATGGSAALPLASVLGVVGAAFLYSAGITVALRLIYKVITSFISYLRSTDKPKIINDNEMTLLEQTEPDGPSFKSSVSSSFGKLPGRSKEIKIPPANRRYVGTDAVLDRKDEEDECAPLIHSDPLNTRNYHLNRNPASPAGVEHDGEVFEIELDNGEALRSSGP